MAFSVNFAARTDVGLVRSRNEDSGYAGPHLLAVADGMGGHAGGNVASSLVLARLAPLDGDSHGSDDAIEILAATIAEANSSLAKAVETDSDLHGMGTTLTALMRAGANGLALVHIGDSRGFLLRDGRFSQITKDHSFVQSLVDSGRISDAEAEHHPQRSLVTRVLTGAPEDEPDLSMREARLGDRYLICSDGLSDYVALDTITEVVTAGLPPDQTTERLVSLALRAGAPDNVTCVIGDIVEPDTQPSSHPIIVGAAAEHHADSTPHGDDSPATKAAALRREATGGNDTNGALVLAEEEDSSRRRWVRFVLLPLIAVLALVGAGYAGYDWSQRQLFIGESDGRVAIFRGVHQNLGPVALFSVLEPTPVEISDLPSFYGDRVKSTIVTGTLDEATTKVAELGLTAMYCRVQRMNGNACGSGPVTLPTNEPVPAATESLPGGAATGGPIGATTPPTTPAPSAPGATPAKTAASAPTHAPAQAASRPR